MNIHFLHKRKNLSGLTRGVSLLVFSIFIFHVFNIEDLGNKCFVFGNNTKQEMNAVFSLPYVHAANGGPNGWQQNKTGQKTAGEVTGGVLGWVGDGVAWAFSWFLIGTLQLWGALIEGAEKILNWVLDSGSVSAVLNSTAITEAWKVVRDFLNVLFIIFLLFSAFATIFQVKKYHLKSVMLMVVIMALLVNFSYPITRFVIDTGNVPMYYMLQKAFASSGSAAAAEISNQSNVVCLLVPNYGECSRTASELQQLGVAHLLAANVFTFMFAVTLLIIAVLFVIRLAMLGFLIVLSPAGFVLAAFPSMQSIAGDWWKQLIKQTFFAPIMVFMIILSVKFIGTLNESALQGIGASGTSTDMGFSQKIALFAIPMVILWSGLIVAMKMGAAGADVVVGGGRKFMMGAIKKVSGYNLGKRHADRWFGQRKAQKEYRARRRTDLAQQKFDNFVGGVKRGVMGAPIIKQTLGKIPIIRNAGKDQLQQAQSTYDALVSDEMGKLKNLANGYEFADRFRNATSRAEKEAIVRQAASTGNMDDMLNDFEHNYTREGLAGFMREQFGESEDDMKLSRTVGAIEAKASGKSHILESSSWDSEKRQYRYTDTDAAHTKRAYAKIFDSIAGEHPQNMMRKLKADDIAYYDVENPVFNPATGKKEVPLKLNMDLEMSFKENMSDGSYTKLLKDQGSQIPERVISRLEEMFGGGKALPDAAQYPRMREMVEKLQGIGKIS